MLLYFFSIRYGDHRDLHSFPTRRSSDLAIVPAVRSTGPRPQLPQRQVDVIADDQDVLQRHLVEIDEDRKSTRLNSSHQIISYAVFCLKKKCQERSVLPF